MSVHVLYRMFDSNRTLLYVGLTGNPPARFKNHKFTKQWWEQVSWIGLEHFPSRKALVTAERKAIVAERPVYNVHNNVAAGHLVTEEIDEYHLEDPDDLCECDSCEFEEECDQCDVCSGRTGKYVLVQYQGAS